MARVAVLLRGVNVGTAKRISSAQLREVVEACGVTGVATLLNSGNAVGTSGAHPATLAGTVAAEVQRQCGFTCDVVVRSQAQVARALADNPLGDAAADPSRHLLYALSGRPAESAVRALRDTDVAPDYWHLVDDDLHAWLPDGVSQSRLQKALTGGVLGVAWTGRNWTTWERIAAAM